jgi:hypothetical protein
MIFGSSADDAYAAADEATTVSDVERNSLHQI